MPNSRYMCATTVSVHSTFAATTTGSNEPSAATKSPRGRITCGAIANSCRSTANRGSVKPNTIATSIAIGDPGDGYEVIHTVLDSGGWSESATDLEIVDAVKLLARTEGIFTEPAGSAEGRVTKN